MPSTPDPSRIGRYQIAARIGRGAMGTVYRAHDPQIGRTVAIKVLDVNDDELRSRFQREVQSAGTLRHPNIVTIHDFGDEGNQPFIVMEYVEGRTLADLLRDRHPFSLAQKLHLVQQLCSALDYAHECGIIHRDIKPANLMVGRDGNLRVVDFGIARVGDTELTRTGALVGTLKYMSPEQIDGGPIDRRTDIFSVGAVLYELLSSQQAFQGETASRVMRAILHEQPPALTGLCPDLDPELERIVDTAIRKDASQRYLTLSQLAADLKGVQEERRQGVPGDQEERRQGVPGDQARVESVADVDGTLIVDRGRRGAAPPAPTARGDSVLAERSFLGVRRAWLVVGLPIAAIVAIAAALAVGFASRMTTSPDTSAVTPPAVTPSPPALPAAGASGAQPQPTVADPGPTRAPVVTTTPSRDDADPVRRPLRPIVEDKKLDVPKLTPYEEAKALLSAGADPGSQLKAAGLLQEACDGGELKGCVELAQMFARATGVARDDARAAALYERACDGGDGTACFRAGLLHRDGSGSVRNLAESVKWFQRACDEGASEGCFNLGLAYARGVAVARDEAKAASLYQQACEGGLPIACRNLGLAYGQGRGVARDDGQARSLFQKACDAGGMLACVDLGLMFGRGLGGVQDELRAVALFQRACDGGTAGGCGNLAGAYARGRGVPRDDARAASLYERACNGGGAPGCAQLAAMYFTGRGVPRDEARAIQLLHRACDGEVAASCQELSQRYEQGRGVERNPTRSAELRRRAQQLSGGRGDDTSAPAGGVVGGIAPPPPPPPKAVAPIRVGGAIKPPVQTKKVNPVYPAMAQSARVQGVVILDVVIGPEGKVADAKVLRSVPLLDQAALDAVKQWEYTPTVVDGVRVPVLATVTVSFSLATPSGGRGRGRR